MNMQTMIMKKLQEVVEKHKLQFIDNTRYANTGIVYIKRQDMTSVFSFTYDFQDTYATLQFFPGDTKPINANYKVESALPDGCKHVDYYQDQDVLGILRYVNGLCATLNKKELAHA